MIETYSIYDGQIYGTPTFNGASGSLSLSLRNNLEAKMASKIDTIDELQKVKLLDNFNFSTSYNFFNRDSLSPSWSPINMNGSTSLFNRRLSVSFRGVMDAFGYDETRSRVTETYYSQSGKLARLTNASLSMGMSFSSQDGKQDDEESDQEERGGKGDPLLDSYGNTGINDLNSGYVPGRDDIGSDYVDFDVPWTLRLDYTLSYRKPRNVSSVVQTVRASGDLSLTPKWKIQFSTGYDIKDKSFTMTSLSLRRDLHCWQMSISVVPFGTYKSYNFTINAKSAILSDLKYNKRKSWQDNF